MPATYITDQDRNFSADTGYAPSGANFYAQAGANLMALPSQMQLMEVKGRQLALLNADRQRRKDIFDEESRIEDEDEYAGFTGFVKGISGLDEESRAAEISKWKMENPWSLDNERIGRASRELFAASDDELKARDNVLKRRRQAIESRDYTVEEQTFDERLAIDDTRRKNTIAELALKREEVERTKEALVTGDVSKVSSLISTSGAFTEEEAGARDSLLAITEDFVRNGDNEALRGLASITGSLAIGMRLPELYKSKFSKHSAIVNRISRASGNKIDVSSLPDDAVQRQAIVEEATRLAAANPRDARALQLFLDEQAGFERARGDIARTKGKLFEGVTKIMELRKTGGANSDQEIRDIMASIKGLAEVSAGYYNNEAAKQDAALKRDEAQSRVDRRYETSKNDARRLGQGDRRIQIQEVLAASREKWRSFDAMEDRRMFFDDISRDGDFSIHGFDKEPTFEEFAEAMNRANPTPGWATDDL